MSRILQLRSKAASIVAQMQAIANAAGDRELTADERTAFDAHQATLTAVKADVTRQEQLDVLGREAGTAADADQAAAAAAQRAAGVRVEVGAPNSEKDPKRGFASPREFLSAVMRAGRATGRSVDPRLAGLRPSPQAAAGSDEAGEYSGPAGGFLVPVGLSGQILSVDGEDPTAEMRTRMVPMEAVQVTFNARVDKNHTSSVSGGLTVTRRPETVALGGSRMTFEQVKLTANNLFGVAFATEEILVDSPASFAALIAAGFRQEFASKLTDERLNGSGVGEFLGILHALNTSLISVTKEVGQAADTILYENIKKMRARVWGYGGAVWHANHDCLPELMSLVQVVGTAGVPVYQPSARDGEPDRLLGRPIYYTEYTNTIGDAGDIVCANWNEYLEGTYQAMQSGESVHVRFLEHERTFKFWTRNDGRPWWLTPLTPKRSAQTLSPFVTLAARA